MIKFRRFAFLLCFLIGTPAPAALLHDRKESAFNCERILDPNFEIIASNRMSHETMVDIKAAAEEIFGAEGVLSKLGISSPKQTIQFMTGSDLNVVSSINRYPVGHWHEGAQIAKGDRSMLIYEIVIPGRTVRHSMFRDDNTFAANVSILMHVAGHNHYAVHNRWRQVRTADLVQESYDLDTYMGNLKNQGIHPDEISRWYQYLLSLSWSQDVINATSIDNIDELKAKPSPQDSRPRIRRTANILQTYLANLSPEIPLWKRDMARRFERLQRYIPGAIRGKIMNEGFATLLQEVVAKHTTYNTFNFGLQFCCLMSGVTSPSMSNPYWLGLEAWRSIYARFQAGYYTRAELDRWRFRNQEAQPDIGALTPIEKDRAFFEWATKNIIEVMDDADTLTFAFRDGAWLSQKNIAISRPVDEDEYDRNMGQPPDPKNNWQWILETRDPERVLRAMITQVKGFEFQFPNVEIVDINDANTGMIRLELSDEIGQRVSLQQRSLVQTLYVHTQINERPVSLESTFDTTTMEAFELILDPGSGRLVLPPKYYGQPVHTRIEQTPDGPKTTYYVEHKGKARIEVRVFPNGNLEAYRVLRDGKDSPDSLPESRLFPEEQKIEFVRAPELEEPLRKMLTAYLDNLKIDEPDQEELDYRDRRFKKSVLDSIEDQVTAGIVGPSVSLQIAVPTVGKALDAYEGYVNRRMQKSLDLALKGKNGIVTRGNSVAIKALPDVPSFRFNGRSMQSAQQGIDLRRLENTKQTLTFNAPFDPDGRGRVSPNPGRPGDRRWGPNPKEGDGNGDPDDGPGEPGDQPGDGREPGDGTDLSWVDIPLEAYARALEEVVELPNLRPKGDKSTTRAEQKGGKAYKRDGTPVNRDIVRKAYKRGMTDILIAGDEDPDDLLPPDIIRRGFAKMRNSDFVVRSTEPKKEPQISAQVTFIMDLSGSMTPYLEQGKRAFYDLRAILMRRYPKIVFQFISFDGTPVVFDDAEKFFKARMGGGTSYVEALKKDLEVKEEFPPAKFDRFTVLVGDMEDHAGPEFEKALREVIAASQYVAALKFNSIPNGFGLGALLSQLHETEEFFGYTEVVPADSYTPYVFRKAFKNEDKE